MKKIIGALFGAVLALPLTLMAYDAGNDAVIRVNVDTYSNFTIVDTNNPFPYAGVVEKFEYYAVNTLPFRIVVVDAGNVVKWVSDEITPSVGVGVLMPDSKPPVLPGWNLAIYSASTGVIPFDDPDAADPAMYEANNAGLPAVDETLTYEGSDDRYYSLNATLFQPVGEILKPETEEIAFNTLNLEATYDDGDDAEYDPVNWAVRKGTCSANTGTVAGNVDGYSDAHEWDGASFGAILDVSGWTPGHYCFVFNPTDEAWQNDVRETRWFWLGKLSADPLVAYNPVGTEHTVTASIGVPAAGVPIVLETKGANMESDAEDTDATGAVSLTYTGAMPGKDTITVCVDEDEEGDCDKDEPSITLEKYWLQYYVTGGAHEKDARGKKNLWGWSGNVGTLLDGTIVGNFHLQNFTTGNMCKLTNFTSLSFSGVPTESPLSDRNKATFVASGTCKDGSSGPFTIVITDVAEPGAGYDIISVTRTGFTFDGTIDGGNFQVHPPEMPVL